MSEETELVEKPEAPVRHLSAGDAVVTIALLLFIIGWVGGWMWGLTAQPPTEKLSTFVSIVIVLIIACPALWAGSMVAQIIGKRD